MTGFVHSTAEIEDGAIIGPDTKVWAYSQIRQSAKVGAGCNIGRNVFIDVGVKVGDNCKIQNNALLYEGLTLEDGVFIGPAVCFTNDRYPRAITPDGQLKTADDWEVGHTVVQYGAAIGAQSVIVSGVKLGRFCLIGSGTVVTRDVPDFAIVIGQPGRMVGFVCRCAQRLETDHQQDGQYFCPDCQRHYIFDKLQHQLKEG